MKNIENKIAKIARQILLKNDSLVILRKDVKHAQRKVHAAVGKLGDMSQERKNLLKKQAKLQTAKIKEPKPNEVVAGVTLKLLKECFKYDAIEGTLSWRRRPLYHFENQLSADSWNRMRAGTPVMMNARQGQSAISDTKFYVGVHGQSLCVADVCWCLHYGTMPVRIKHINNRETDFRINNLKDVASLT